MLEFKQWIEANQTPIWKAKKKEIIPFWKALPNNLPLIPYNVVPKGHQGSTHAYDGIRITGSRQFVNSAISKLKDMLNYEGDRTKLYLLYRQQVDKNSQSPLPNSFVFYVQVKERAKKQ
jgi:hypothetical protein